MNVAIIKTRQFFFRNIPKDYSLKEIIINVMSIAGPSFIELILLELSSFVDNAMVGRLGAEELTSVGFCMQPNLLMASAFVALNSGATAIISRMKGSGDRNNARLALNQAIIMTFFLTIIISFLGFIFAEKMIYFMGARDTRVIYLGAGYFKIRMAAYIFQTFTMSITAGLTGIGKTKVSMYYNIAANIINVVCNYVLIYGKFGAPKMGVFGAAIGTVAGQIFAFIIAFIIITRKKSYLYLNIKELFFIDITMIKRILKIGMPAMSEQVIMRTGIILYTLVVTSLGTTQYAAHLIGIEIMAFSYMNGQAFGIASTSLMGQSMGLGRNDLAKIYTYICRTLGMLSSMAMAILFILFYKHIWHLFTNDETIIYYGKYIMILLAIYVPIQSSQMIVSGALRGAGDTVTVAVCTLLSVLLLRPAVSFCAVHIIGLGVIGAWGSTIIDQLVRYIITVRVFNKGKWEKIKV